jgi:hypothetical protein
MDPEVRRFSDALGEPLIKAYRLGGFGLAFLLLGAFLLASAAAVSGPLGYVLAGLGLILVVVPCYFFYVKEIRPIARAQRAAKREAEVIDSVQDAALEMTRTADALSWLALTNAREISDLLRLTGPALQRIPGLGRIVGSPRFEQADLFAGQVVAATERAEQVITDVQRALTEADASQLKKYVGELRTLRVDLRDVVKSAAQQPIGSSNQETETSDNSD